MSHGHAAPAQVAKSSGGRWIISAIPLALAVVLIIARYKYPEFWIGKTEQQETKQTAVIEQKSAIPAPASRVPEQDFWEGTTPVKIDNLKGWANIEVDGNILMYYQGESKPVLLTPGAPCKQHRARKYDGWTRFVSEADPINGKVAFRAYKMTRGCNN